MPELTQSELLRLEKIAQTLIFTSQGTPFISAGNPHDIETFRRDLYYSKLIELRKAHPAFRMKSAEMVSKNIFFFPTSSDNLFAFMIDGSECGDTSEKIIVAFNTGKNKSIMEIPKGEYKVVCAKGRIDTNGLYKISGSSLHVGPMQAVILCSI